uniref:Cytochrome c oxidase subunit 2 n=1 Tax=Hydrometra greeni TaxID=1492928 RepID=C5HIN9_9HEMI|nr:cytochrome c oxidase subunit II [Hydrometra greeni]ACJ69484.1 cytochrome c oxidase subunit II [Hydrometra greeni]
MMTWNQINLQNANSPIMEQLIMFHDNIMMILIMITITVGIVMNKLILNKKMDRFNLENQNIELIWTILPIIILIVVAMPSIKILYMMDEIKSPMITIKSIGHQWYWTYEYSDFKKIEFESYMKPTQEIEMNEFRLIETDNRVILPINTQIRMLSTSTDVIHSWTIQSLGIKIDAIPGRLNQALIYINRPGIMYGQCSEICGANHSFMPITIEAINMKNFINWIKNY